MFTDLVAASNDAIRRARRKPALGRVLASNGHRAAHTPDILDTLDDLQQTYVTPVLDRVLDAAEQHLAGTPIDTTTRAAVAALDAFQREQVDPLIDCAMATSAALLREYVLPLLPARVRTLRVEDLPLLGDARQQHVRLLAGADDCTERTPEEQRLNRLLAVGTVTFALASFATVLYPPLMLLSLPGLLYTTAWLLVDGYRQLVEERRVGLDVINATATLALLMTGHWWVAAFTEMLFIPSGILLVKTRRRSRQRLVNTLSQTSRFVWVVHNATEVRLPFEQLQVGDVVVVGAGEVIPIDGTIISGIASIDQHRLTGEAQPAEKSSGEAVYAATIVLAGRLHIRVEQAGAATVAAQIGAVLNRTADYQTLIELRGTRLADTSALPQILLSAITLPLLGPIGAIAVLGCSIGYQLCLSGPISVLNFLYIAAEHGILVKDGRAMETLAYVDTVVFDKTGTLTHEQPHVGAVHSVGSYDEHSVLQLAAAAETRQTHPIARAILHAAQTRQLAISAIDEADYEPGYGLRVGLQDGRTVRVGSLRFMQAEGIALPAAVQSVQVTCHEQGHSLVYVAADDHLAGVIELHTSIRPEVEAVIAALHARGLQLAIVSGDQPQPTLHLAQRLGIDHAFAEVLPQEKASLVAQLQREGRTVCFVGDGINDAIALKQAHVSVSLQGATTVATDTAEVVLMGQSLQQIPLLFDLAAQLQQNMQGNYLVGTVPGITNIGSVYLLHTGVLMAATLSWMGLVLGLTNAMLPMIRHLLYTRFALPDRQTTDRLHCQGAQLPANSLNADER